MKISYKKKSVIKKQNEKSFTSYWSEKKNVKSTSKKAL